MVINRVCTVRVLPTTAPLIIEALKEGGRDRKKVKKILHNGNIKLDDVIRIAKTLRENKKSMSIEFTGTCLEVLGTCVSLGCTVDGKSPKEVTQLIKDGEIKC